MAQIAGYIRVSGLSQVDGDGFRRQSETIARFCEREGHVHMMDYVEYGITGDADLSGRIALACLIHQIKNDPSHPHTIAVEDFTRMARGTMAGLLILDDVLKAGATVYLAINGMIWSVDRNDGEGRFVWTVLQAAAEFEKSKTLARFNAAKAAFRSLGKKADGQRRYGVLPKKIRDPKVLVKVQRELAALERIKNMERMGPTRITRELNAAGIMKRNGRPWDSTSVSKLLARIRASEGRAYKKRKYTRTAA